MWFARNFNVEQRKTLASFFTSLAVAWYVGVFVVPYLSSDFTGLIIIKYLGNMLVDLIISYILLVGIKNE